MPQPSYCRNRDYTNDFNWTYELKTDVYRCYIEARNDKSNGYMKRLKNLWDKMHPEYNFLSEKNLRDKASRVHKNNVVIDTEYRETSTSITRNDNRCIDTDNGNNYGNIVPNENIVPDEVIAENIPNENLNDEQLQLVEKLKPSFNSNFETFKLQTIEERVYTTKINKKIPTDYLKAINTVACEYLTSIDNITFWDINVSIYTTAVTIKQELNDLKEINRNINSKNTSPRWTIKFEDSINRMRKEIGQIHTLINSKKSNTFTAHQLSVKHKCQKKYGNTKTRTLEYKLALLKHDLKATCTKFKYIKRKYQRKTINRSFSKDPKGVYRNFRGTKINLRTYRARMKLNRSGKVFGVKMLHLIKMLPG